MTESDQYPAEAVAEPQGEPEAAPVSAEPETAEATQAAQEPEETVAESASYLAPKPETPETPEPVTEPTAADAASGLATGAFRDHLLGIPVTREWPAAPVLQFDPAFDENPVDHPSRLPPACRPCKA